MKRLFFTIVLSIFLMAPGSWAGVKLKISDDTDIDLGFRLQAQYLSTDNRAGTT